MLEAADDAAIRRVLAEYSLRLDGRDFTGMAELFADDGEWVSRNGQARGREAIAALLREITLGHDIGGVRRARRHIVSNISITAKEADVDTGADVVSNFVAIQQSDGGLRPSSLGTYFDTLVKRRGQWLFLHRCIVHDV
jgi:uncharacterized protein (TIGR02246 family)